MILDNYILYLAFVTTKLEKFFENQSPYIRCKKGCSKCCEDGCYPFSKAEFDFLIIGFLKLPAEIQKKVKANICKLKAEQTEHKNKFPNKDFMHKCPFLIDNECCVYDYRGIICRSFGLISINDKGASKIPFCAFEGLNYANVLEPETKIISLEKYKKLNIDKEPLAFNVSYDFLTSKDMEQQFNITFGEKRALIDWF